MSDPLPLYMKLFERCEEMRPTVDGLGVLNMTMETDLLGHRPANQPTFSVYWWGEGADAALCGQQEALALCFRAVVVWILEHNPKGLTIWKMKDLDHALISAANAVLDEQEKAK